MAKGLKSLGDILLGIVSFGLSYWFYRGHLEQYVHYIAHYGFYFQVLLNIVIIVLLSYVIYAFLKLLLTRKLKKQTLFLLYLIYFIALFLKNIGLQGLSLNPLSFARELYWGSHFVPIMNLLMFIPLGLLFPSRLSNLLLCLITLFSIESIQYFGHMGIFDLGDIVLNMLGILIGNAIHQLPQFQTLIKKILI